MKILVRSGHDLVPMGGSIFEYFIQLLGDP